MWWHNPPFATDSMWWRGKFFVIDSVWKTFPWAAIGVILLVITVALTKKLGSMHARFAQLMLGPSQRTGDAPGVAAMARGTSNVEAHSNLWPGV